MVPSVGHFVVLGCVLAVAAARADVSSVRAGQRYRPQSQPLHRFAGTRLQRLEEANVTPYPASGYRPPQNFNLPNERPTAVFNGAAEDAVETRPPNGLYSAPARLPQQTYAAPSRLSRPTYSAPAPQRTYLAPAPPQAERLAAKPARLTSNREEREDEEDAAAASDIEADIKASAKNQQPAQLTAHLAYFVQPLTAAAYYQPAVASAYTAAYYAPVYAAAVAPSGPAVNVAMNAASIKSPPAATAARLTTAAALPATPLFATPLLQYSLPTGQLQAW